MATLTITVPDTAVTRIRAAFGQINQPATVNQVQDALKQYIRDRVLTYEQNQQRQALLDDANAKIAAAVQQSNAEPAW